MRRLSKNIKRLTKSGYFIYQKNKRISTLKRIKQGRENFKMLMEEKHSKYLSSEKKREEDAGKINNAIERRQEKATSVFKRRLMQAKIKEQIDDIRQTEHKQNMEVVKYAEVMGYLVCNEEESDREASVHTVKDRLLKISSSMHTREEGTRG